MTKWEKIKNHLRAATEAEHKQKKKKKKPIRKRSNNIWEIE